ncbi:fam-a protein [Plasmodium chabaudi chabaudi]|uniref:Fam-a protein n=1 Tax=Plasmodium chabaudi chabaudi TaxID=31271 RepID=A0A4V0K5Y6_PLACU|nr:fam-a protein [Plasmodium chabaudi chabaudi]VTZ67884.1 fam-a protein [Plasmodium chabaudi chabaudi]
MYNDIVKMFYETKDLYSFGSNDNKGKVIREYYPNLKMIQRSYQNDNTPFNTYSFSLTAKVEQSENVTIIGKASIDIYDDANVDKKKKQKKRQKKCRRKQSNHVAITYVKYIDHCRRHQKSLLNVYCRGCEGKKYQI